MKGNKQRSAVTVVLIDIACIAIGLVVFSLFHHVLHFDKIVVEESSFIIDTSSGGLFHPAETTKPSTGSSTTSTTAGTAVSTTKSTTAGTVASTTAITAPTETKPSAIPDGTFTGGEVIKTDTSYKSKYISVTLSEVKKNGVTYFVQDIYVQYIECFATALAGKAYSNYVDVIAKDNNAVGAINGDYCFLTGYKNCGAIRNGTLYGNKPNNDICILYRDGTMKTVLIDDFDGEAEIAKGAWQAWDFGPPLLDESGKAFSVFPTHESISGGAPRSAIGYYSPGHYCFITVGGREKGYACGVKMYQLADLFEELGCSYAYNLDGGQSAIMTFGEKIVNELYNGTGRKTTDIVFVRDYVTE